MNYDCTEGFVCSGEQNPDTGLNEGTAITCGENQIIKPNLADPINYECVDAANATCSLGGLHYGCPAGQVECVPSKYGTWKSFCP